MTVRWLANENFPLASIVKLRAEGHDVAAILRDSPGIADDEVLARAVHEDRIILTFDRDYGELIFQRKLPPPPGIVYFRFIPRTPEESAERLIQLLAVPGLMVEGRFSTVERDQVRQRMLP
jgi:predicted nuclease of predicted toxin-antitoxin system